MSRRSVLAAVGVATAAAVALSACSTAAPQASGGATSAAPSGTASSAPQALTIATDNPTPMKAVVEAFEKANPDVKITLQEAGNDYQTFLRTSLTAGTAADVIRTFPGSGNVVSVGQLYAAGALLDLSDASWAGELSATQNELFKVDGKLLSIPFGALGLGPVYNETTLKELGATIPATFSEVLALCETARDKGKVAYSLFLKGGSSIPTYAYTAALVYGPDPAFTAGQIAGTKSFAGSGWVRAFELQKQMLDAGCFNEGPTGTEWSTSFDQVAKGEAVATIAFSDTSGIESLAPAGTSVAIAPLPVDDSGDLYLPVADSSGFGIYAGSKNVELAKRFIDFMATADGQNIYAAASNGAPALANDSYQATHPNQQVVLDYIKSGKTATWPDQGWVGTATQNALMEISQSLFLGSETPDSAAKKMDEAFAKDLKDAK